MRIFLGCKEFTREDNTSKQKTEEILKKTSNNKNGNKLKMSFNKTNNKVIVNYNGETIELIGQKVASGILYTNTLVCNCLRHVESRFANASFLLITYQRPLFVAPRRFYVYLVKST
ncbi:hypothetical protein BTO05_00785 [Winogradskyella sp. PC-19]|nr:hypothetical protein BTO05_00785 [Winogradskyella sp. PC-19]